MKYFIVFCFFVLSSCSTGQVATITSNETPNTTDTTGMNSTKYDFTPDAVLANAFASKDTNLVIQVLIKARVTKILSDDTVGDKHQQFIVTLQNGQTIKIAHNIDVAPRVSPLNVGDVIFAYGEYGYNSQGGYVHWTHRNTGGTHPAGWIEVNGTKFQ